MLLQIALDKPEHLGALPSFRGLADIIEIGTPLLKRFGIAAIATAKELCPNVPVLADTKTVDGGIFEAEMVFGAGADFMTVLSCASESTHASVHECAKRYGCSVVFDTITETGKDKLLPAGLTLPDTFKYVALHAPTDDRLAGRETSVHIDSVAELHAQGFKVSLAGGIGPDNLDAVLQARPEIAVVGSAITEASNPTDVARWLKTKIQ